MKKPVPTGFTLVETMVAIAILSVAIAGPLLTAERAAAAAYAAKNELIASYLAQEGVEYIRAMRDDAYLADYEADSGKDGLSAEAWSDFLTKNPSGAVWSIKTCANNAKGCAYDPTKAMGTGSLGTAALIPCSSKYCTDIPLYFDAGTAIYTPESGSGTSKTPFSRQITFSCVPDPDNCATATAGDITSTVSWSTDGISYTTSISDTLTPWQ
jgi:prepilin-type N-terminal cleavage/methylation domain-containing protein